MPVISIASAKILEGRPGSSTHLRVVATLSAPAAQQVKVDFTTADSTKAKLLATAGSDYLATSGKLTFEVGQVEAFIDIVTLGDNLIEGDEAFDIVLSNAEGASLGKATSLTATATISDDEPTLSIKGTKIDEGAALTGGKLRFTISLSAPAPQPVSVDYITGEIVKDPATTGSDFTLTSGTLVIPVGKKQGYVDVPILSDSLVEANESFDLILSNAVGASLGKASSLSASGTIVDDEAASGGTGTLSISTTSGYEGETLYFTVSLSAPTSYEVKASYSVAAIKSKEKTGIAKIGADFVKASGILSFAPGETARVIPVQTADDSIWEGNETFAVSLSKPIGASLAGGAKTLSATGTLLDDEPTISATGAKLYEPITPSDGSTYANGLNLMRFSAALSAPTDHIVSVSYSTVKTKDATATSGKDFVSKSGKLTFAAGETSAYIDIAILDDALAEADETVSLILSKPVGAALSGNTSTLTVVGTILDNEPSLSL